MEYYSHTLLLDKQYLPCFLTKVNAYALIFSHTHTMWILWLGLIIGGCRGGRGTCGPPFSPFSFVFMQFLAHIVPNNRLAPPGVGAPWEILDPPLLIEHFTNYIIVLTKGYNLNRSYMRKKFIKSTKTKFFQGQLFSRFSRSNTFQFFSWGDSLFTLVDSETPTATDCEWFAHEPLVTGLSLCSLFHSYY